MPVNIKRTLKITSLILTICLVFLIFIAYFYYLDLKKTFVEKICDKSTASIGQRVDIRDLSFSPSGGINIYDISIRNPQGFDSEQLLRIKRLYLKIKFSELFKGKLHLRNITVYSPELTLMKDKTGRLNVSDKFMQLFKRKPTIKYQIDEFDIDSGIFDFNRDKRYRNNDISMHLKNLSSDSGIRTLINGDILYAGENRIRIDGWAYLKDEPKKLNVSISSEDDTHPAFGDLFYRYKINAGIEKIDVNLELSSDMETSVRAEAFLKILRAEKYLLEKPADINLSVNTRMDLNKVMKSISGNFAFSTGKVVFHGINSVLVSGNGKFNGKDFYVDIPGAEVAGGKIKLIVKGKASGGPFPLEINATAENIDIGVISTALQKISEIPYSTSGNIKNAVFNLTVHSVDSLYGNASVKARRISIAKTGSKRNMVKDVYLNSEIRFEGNDFKFKADAGAGNISTRISGTVRKFGEKNRSIKIKATLPQVKVADVRDAFWDTFPDSFLYAGLNGYVSSDISIDYNNSKFKINGELTLRDFILEGENHEYSAGPINGTIPVSFDNAGGKQETIKIPSFERSEFDNLSNYYLQKTNEDNFSRITIGSFNYGFRLLENINVWINQEGNVLTVGRFSSNIFGGMLNGSAVIDISNGLHYRAGIILKGLSLTKLCDGIEPIKGYISGKVDGIANIKGSGIGISQLIGKADFWTYSTDNEKTKISREFLHKIGGPSLKTYLGDRSFDKGIMSLYLQNGFVIFKELEISNRNFLGIKDLSIKVAPFNNKIAIDHLMWTITEAAQRAGGKQ
jgi:hypothetical protein